MSKDIREGGCLCGAVRFKLDLTDHHTGNCHCRDCQKNSGAPFMTFTDILSEQVIWTKDQPKRIQTSELAERMFCGKCGAPLVGQALDERERISISTSTLDDPSGIDVTYELYTRSRWPMLKPIQGTTQYLKGSSDASTE